MRREGGGLHNNDHLTCPQYENCYQVAEDKNENKKIKWGTAAVPSGARPRTQALPASLIGYLPPGNSCPEQRPYSKGSTKNVQVMR